MIFGISSSLLEMCRSLRVHFTIFGGAVAVGRYANRQPSNPILGARLTFTNYTIKSSSKEAIFEYTLKLLNCENICVC